MQQQIIAKFLKVQFDRLSIFDLILLLDSMYQFGHFLLVHLHAGPFKGQHQFVFVDFAIAIDVDVFEENMEFSFILQTVVDKLGKVNVSIQVRI